MVLRASLVVLGGLQLISSGSSFHIAVPAATTTSAKSSGGVCAAERGGRRTASVSCALPTPSSLSLSLPRAAYGLHQERRRRRTSLLLHDPHASTITATATSLRQRHRHRVPPLHMAASSSPSDRLSNLGNGCLIVVAKGNRNVLGLVKEADGKKNWIVLDEIGRKSSVSPKDIRYVLPGAGSIAQGVGKKYTLEDLQRLLSASDEEDNETVQLAWELLNEEMEDSSSGGGGGAQAGAVSPEEFAELVLDDAGVDSCYAAWRMMDGKKGRLLFKPRKDGTFECRARVVVTELLKQNALEEQQEERKKNFADMLKQIVLDNTNSNSRAAALASRTMSDDDDDDDAGGGVEGGSKGASTASSASTWSPASVSASSVPTPLQLEGLANDELAMIESLKKMAGLSMRPKAPVEDGERLGGELLTIMGRGISRMNAFKLCIQLGLMDEHQNLFVTDTHWGEPFSDEVEAAAVALMRTDEEGGPSLADPDASIRQDLRHLKTYTVDSEDTREVDDALSVERLEDGRERLWVHIADVSRFVEHGSVLFREAQKRQTSIYLPEGGIPMLPIQLGEQLMSLNVGKDCEALSMSVILKDNGDIDDVEIMPSTIRVDYRLSYDEVDDMIYEGVADNEEWPLGRLLHWANKRHKYRSSNGAADRFFRAPQCTVKVKGRSSDPTADVDVYMQIDDPEKNSARLVTEMMVMAGEALGMLGTEHDIPLPYRKQAVPDDVPEESWFEQFPERYCRAQAVYRFMKAAETSTSPGPHFGLGISSYVQWSSPIRRFTDLIVHYQLKKWLHSRASGGEGGGAGGSALFSSSDIAYEVRQGESSISTGNRIQRDSSKYWAAEYFRQGGDVKEYDAVVIGVADARGEDEGKRIYTILLVDVGWTERIFETSDRLQPGQRIFVRAERATPRGMQLKMTWRFATPADGQAENYEERKQDAYELSKL